MALATQCPHCQTTFRVVHDQLKLRAGLVRCGYCKEIFNGIEHLLPPDDAVASPAPAATPVPPTASDDSPHAAFSAAAAFPAPSEEEFPSAPDDTAAPFDDSEEAVREEDAPESFTAAASPSPASVMPTSRLSFTIPSHFEREHHPPVYEEDDPKPADPLQRMTLLDFDRELPDSLDDLGKDGSITEPETDELDQAMADLQRKPWRRSSAKKNAGEPDIDDELEQDDEPGFVRKERARQQLGGKLRSTLIVACCVLVIAALLQASYIFRNQLAGMFPSAKPVLTALCSAIGCRIALPTHINSVSIESSELQTQTGDSNTFSLTTLLRNESGLNQEWPLIELTLNDANEKPVLRRVFTPFEYLRNQDEVRIGFAATSERTVRVTFALSETKASGYRVYLFYP